VVIEHRIDESVGEDKNLQKGKKDRAEYVKYRRAANSDFSQKSFDDADRQETVEQVHRQEDYKQIQKAIADIYR
jgi:hypothetical protein